MNKKIKFSIFALILPLAITVSSCGDGESKQQGEEVNPPISHICSDTRWQIDLRLRGIEFRDTLAELINSHGTKTATYKACLSIGQKAAEKGEGKFVPFYHGEDYAISTDSNCNREHVWPDSRGGGTKNGGGNIEIDPFVIRPAVSNDNSSRSNYFYGDKTQPVNGEYYTKQWDPSKCGYDGARGEAARVIFYIATRYGKSNGLSLSNNPDDAKEDRTMGTLKFLIEWNRTYPVTNMEKQINDYLCSQGYGRNPFVDHPEFAEYIWNENGLNANSNFLSPNASNTANYTYNFADCMDDLSNAMNALAVNYSL